MTIFALITEGLTDQAILENLLIGHYYEQQDDIDFIYAQPLRDETDESRQANFGGWEKVLEYCSNEEDISDILSRSTYAIIQIDTDCAQHQNFGVKTKDEQGGSRATIEVIQDTKKLIESKIPTNILRAFKHKLIYAIAVHSTECWLLPLHKESKNSHANEVNCERKLAHALSQAKKNHLIIKKEQKTIKCYEEYLEISNDLKKPGIALSISPLNSSLETFIQSLPTI